jgi:hypothetical protein
MEKFLKLTAGSNVTILNASSIQFVAATLANPTLVDVLYGAGGATAGTSSTTKKNGGVKCVTVDLAWS